MEKKRTDHPGISVMILAIVIHPEVAQGLVQGRGTMGTDHLDINDMILVNVIHPENKKVPQETGGSHHQDGMDDNKETRHLKS
jgi:hypothetical protein